MIVLAVVAVVVLLVIFFYTYGILLLHAPARVYAVKLSLLAIRQQLRGGLLRHDLRRHAHRVRRQLDAELDGLDGGA